MSSVLFREKIDIPYRAAKLCFSRSLSIGVAVLKAARKARSLANLAASTDL